MITSKGMTHVKYQGFAAGKRKNRTDRINSHALATDKDIPCLLAQRAAPNVRIEMISAAVIRAA
jgi:hypothetical protein